MAQRVSKIKASKVILDYDLYPRPDISSFTVNGLVEALRSGCSLPPIIVDKASKRVIDGFHRVRAYQKEYGPDALIPCVYRQYPDEAAMLIAAMEANSRHGRCFSPFDRARCLALAENFKIEIQVVAKALNMTVDSLGAMKVARLGFFHQKPLVLKRTTAHLAGGELTAEQAEYNKHAGGPPATFFINQIIMLIESGSVDWDNEKVLNALRRLRDLLDKAEALQLVEA